MELCSMLCASLDGRGIWGRKDTCICMAESLHSSPETITTVIPQYKNKNLKFGGKKPKTNKHKNVCVYTHLLNLLCYWGNRSKELPLIPNTTCKAICFSTYLYPLLVPPPLQKTSQSLHRSYGNHPLSPFQRPGSNNLISPFCTQTSSPILKKITTQPF